MKNARKIVGVMFGCALVAAGFALSGANASASDLSELSAKAGDYCAGAPNSDCQSSATGNIYPNMEAADF